MKNSGVCSASVSRKMLFACVAVAPLAASTRADTVFVWGENDDSVGYGTVSTTPVPVPALGTSATAVGSGATNYYAIAGGGLYAWGNNAYGQCGLGTSSSSPQAQPTAVPSLASSVTAVTGAQNFALAIANGGLYAFGRNNSGQLGNNTTVNSGTPVGVSGLSSGVTAVAAGSYSSTRSTALAIKSGALYAWGDNASGQLGDDSTLNSLVPTPVNGMGSGVTAVATASAFSFAVRSGAAYSWGDNSTFALGNTPSDAHVPNLITGLSSGVTAIAAGYDYGLAVKGGNVYGWGSDESAQLADATRVTHTTAIQIDPSDLHDIVEVAIERTTSFALRSDGTLWAWGDNSYGYLGTGYVGPYNAVPAQVSLPPGYIFTSVDSDGGAYHVIALAVPEPSGMAASLISLSLITCRRRYRKDGSPAESPRSRL